MTIQASYAEIEGARLYYEVAGSGFPLVLIHGFGADRRVWDYLFETLANHYRVVRYDSRGFGKSSLPTTAPYTHPDDLKALLDHLAIPQAHIMGQSLGGEIAVEFALAYPEMTRSLILVDSNLGGYQFSAEHHASFNPMGAKTAESGFKSAIELLMAHPMHVPLSEQPAAADKLRQMLADYSAWHMANADTWQRPDPPAIQQLECITAPTLVTIAERDVAGFHEIADILAARLPNARKAALPGIGHVVPLEAPDALLALTIDFLAAVDKLYSA